LLDRASLKKDGESALPVHLLLVLCDPPENYEQQLGAGA